MRFFSKLLRRGAPLEDPAPLRSRPAEAVGGIRTLDLSDEAPRPPAPPEAPVPAADPADENPAELFGAIQEILGPGEDLVALPARVLLANLPEELRGPKWKENGGSAGLRIELDRADLLAQLRRGRVIYPLADLCMALPPGWVRRDEDALVELSLPDLVEALPPELIRGSGELSADTRAVAGMRDFFRPHEAAEPGAPAAPAAPPPAAPAPAQPPAPPRPAAQAAPAAAPARGPSDAGAGVVDLNRATAEQLAGVPGLGPVRAALVVSYRAAHGPFASVYGLLDVPGIGRKLFKRLTGLEAAPTKRRDRHEVLNAQLGFEPGERPSLGRIAERTAERFALAGCVIGGRDGMVLARSPGMGDEADRYAALVPRMYQRCAGSLKRLGGTQAELIVVPTMSPPMAVAGGPGFCLVGVWARGADVGPAIAPLQALARELDWLMRPRLAVGGPAV